MQGDTGDEAQIKPRCPQKSVPPKLHSSPRQRITDCDDADEEDPGGTHWMHGASAVLRHANPRAAQNVSPPIPHSPPVQSIPSDDERLENLMEPLLWDRARELSEIRTLLREVLRDEKESPTDVLERERELREILILLRDVLREDTERRTLLRERLLGSEPVQRIHGRAEMVTQDCPRLLQKASPPPSVHSLPWQTGAEESERELRELKEIPILLRLDERELTERRALLREEPELREELLTLVLERLRLRELCETPLLLREEPLESEPVQRMQGRVVMVTQDRFWFAQKASPPPLLHSSPRQIPRELLLRELREIEEELERELLRELMELLLEELLLELKEKLVLEKDVERELREMPELLRDDVLEKTPAQRIQGRVAMFRHNWPWPLQKPSPPLLHSSPRQTPVEEELRELKEVETDEAEAAEWMPHVSRHWVAVMVQPGPDWQRLFTQQNPVLLTAEDVERELKEIVELLREEVLLCELNEKLVLEREVERELREMPELLWELLLLELKEKLVLEKEVERELSEIVELLWEEVLDREPLQRMHGRVEMVTQDILWLAQKLSPPLLHSSPRQTPAEEDERELKEMVELLREEPELREEDERLWEETLVLEPERELNDDEMDEAETPHVCRHWVAVMVQPGPDWQRLFTQQNRSEEELWELREVVELLLEEVLLERELREMVDETAELRRIQLCRHSVAVMEHPGPAAQRSLMQQ